MACAPPPLSPFPFLFNTPSRNTATLSTSTGPFGKMYWWLALDSSFLLSTLNWVAICLFLHYIRIGVAYRRLRWSFFVSYKASSKAWGWASRYDASLHICWGRGLWLFVLFLRRWRCIPLRSRLESFPALCDILFSLSLPRLISDMYGELWGLGWLFEFHGLLRAWDQ